jgi:Ser/Thr protein kinase RdoA (MazF antagonist)
VSSPTIQHLQVVKELWDLKTTPIFHRYVANHIYFGIQSKFPENEVVVRLTGPLGKSKSEIQAELDWIYYLDQCGMRVAEPVPSKCMQLLETIETSDGIFYACVFKKIHGRTLETPIDFSESILTLWGRYLGRMHRHIKNYRVQSHRPTRPMWDTDNLNMQALQNARIENSNISKVFYQKLEWAHSLPSNSNNFGLVHCDLHPGNFLIDNFENLHAFDFDDGNYNWFAYDFAHIIFSLRRRGFDKDLPFGFQKTIQMIFAAYSIENEIEIDPVVIENFYHLRLCQIYHWAQFRKLYTDPSAVNWYLEELQKPLNLTLKT